MTRAGQVVVFCTLLLSAADAFAQHAIVPRDLVALDSDEGRRLFDESTAKTDFFALAGRMESQQTQAFCGVASGVAALNALPVRAPAVDKWAPYHSFTQDNIWNACGRRVIGPDEVNRGGMTLAQLRALLQCHAARARVVLASTTTEAAFRRDMSAAVTQPGTLVIVNFSREVLGQDGGGHFSPVAAYHAGSDKFLMLDVARYKFPPLWVPAAKLWAAMNTTDRVAGATRGYLVVSAAPNALPPGSVAGSNFLIKALAAIVTVSIALGFALGNWFGRSRARRRSAAAAH